MALGIEAVKAMALGSEWGEPSPRAQVGVLQWAVGHGGISNEPG